MNRFLYQLKNKKFISNFIEFQKTRKYKIIMFFIIILVFLSIFLTMLFIYPFDNKQTIINNPSLVISANLLPLLVGIISGVGLSVAGAAMQGVTKNALAGPTTLGFLPVATLGIFVAKAAGFSKETYLFYIFAFIFSLIPLLINFFSNNFSNSSSNKVILIGLVFGSIITCVNAILSSRFPAIAENVQMWIGATDLSYFKGNTRWEKFYYSLPLIIIGFILILINCRKITILESDSTLAFNLGINIKKLYWIVGISSILLTISVVNLIGSTVIIGIVIPHIVRGLLKTKNYFLITTGSSFLCATMLMIALYINTFYSLGINLYASLISVPFFIYIIFFKKKE